MRYVYLTDYGKKYLQITVFEITIASTTATAAQTSVLK